MFLFIETRKKKKEEFKSIIKLMKDDLPTLMDAEMLKKIQLKMKTKPEIIGDNESQNKFSSPRFFTTTPTASPNKYYSNNRINKRFSIGGNYYQKDFEMLDIISDNSMDNSSFEEGKEEY